MQRLIAADIPQRLRAPAADASEVKWRGSVSQFETQPGARSASTLIVSPLLLNFRNKLLPMAALMMVAEMLMVTSVVVWI